MDEIKVIINDEEYTESQFEKDIVRMFDKYRYADSEHMGENSCKDVVCENCPLDGCCGERIRIVYNWAKVHPVITNKDMLKKTFGKDVIHYIEARSYKEEWLDEEYKEPSKQSKEEE